VINSIALLPKGGDLQLKASANDAIALMGQTCKHYPSFTLLQGFANIFAAQKDPPLLSPQMIIRLDLDSDGCRCCRPGNALSVGRLAAANLDIHRPYRLHAAIAEWDSDAVRMPIVNAICLGGDNDIKLANGFFT
jgi:hypothetical protein